MLDWNDWQYFLAVRSHGTLAKAGRAMEVNATTVGRRVQALEGALGVRLFQKDRSQYRLTAAGAAISEAVESLREAASAIERTAHAVGGRLDGKIRIACTEAMAVRHVVPYVGEFERRHPDLELELVTSNESVNLSEREADVAIRLLRPREKGLRARKAGEIRVALHASQQYLSRHRDEPLEEPFSGHTFIGYSGRASRWLEATWLAQHAPAARLGARLDSLLAIAAAAEQGLGLALLPCGIGDEKPELERIADPERVLRREIWLVYHADLQRSPKVRAALDFLGSVLQKESARLRGRT